MFAVKRIKENEFGTVEIEGSKTLNQFNEKLLAFEAIGISSKTKKIKIEDLAVGVGHWFKFDGKKYVFFRKFT